MTRGVTMRYLILLIGLLLVMGVTAADGATPLEANGQLHVDQTTGKLTNQYGTAIQLRGMSSHGLQWYRDMMNPTALKALQENWGADVVRLSTYIQEGGYENNPSFYKVLVDSLINEVSKAGMYVIIDFHQLYPGDPWFNIDHAVEFFTHMAQTHKDRNNVFYEVCNEPNSYKDGGATYLGYDVNWSVIKSYADSVISVIRQYDTKNICLVGTPTWDQEPQAVIGKEINDLNVMYTVHFYAGTHGSWTLNNLKTAVNNNIPVFVTECGTQDASGDGPNDFANSATWFDYLDANKISWVNWNFSPDPRSGAVFKSSPSNYSDYNYYTNDANLKEAGLWIKNRMKTADDWGQVVITVDSTVIMDKKGIKDTVSTIDSTYQPYSDTIVHTLKKEYTVDSLITQIDSLSNSVIFNTIYDTTVTSYSPVTILDKMDTLYHTPDTAVDTTVLVHDIVADTITKIDSTVIASLDTVVHTVMTEYRSDSIVAKIDSLLDGIIFDTQYDTTVFHDTILLKDVYDTLYQKVDTTVQIDTTIVPKRDTVTVVDTIWGKGKKNPDKQITTVSEVVGDMLIISTKTLGNGSLISEVLDTVTLAQTLLLKTKTVIYYSSVDDPDVVIDSLHKVSYDTLKIEDGRYTNWAGDTIVNGAYWREVIDTITIIGDSLKVQPPVHWEDIVYVKDTMLLSYYTDTLKQDGVVGDTTTMVDTILTTTTYDTLITVDSLIDTPDTIVTTTARERQTDSLFMQIDTLVDGVKIGKNSFDTTTVISQRLLYQKVDTLTEQKVDVIPDVINPLGASKLAILFNPWKVGSEQEPQLVFHIPASFNSPTVTISIFDRVANKLYEQTRTVSAMSDRATVLPLPASQLGLHSGSYLVVVEIVDGFGNRSVNRRVLGIQE